MCVPEGQWAIVVPVRAFVRAQPRSSVLESLLLCIVVLAAALLAWRDGMRAREAAVEVCRRTCRSYGVQLLDDTVALSRLRLVGDVHRGVAVRRIYEFEVSADGYTREGGSVTLTGGQVDSIWVPGPPE